jgi:hypothetical protein
VIALERSVDGPWGAQPAIRAEDPPTAEEVVSLLERHIAVLGWPEE